MSLEVNAGAESAPGDGPTDDVQWLTPVEQESWRGFLTASRLVLDRLESDLQADAGMPFTYYDILVKLSEAPQRTLRMGALAAVLRSSSSRLSHAVSRLEECGWVRRESHPSDRRGQFAALTDDGFTALSQAAPCHVAAVRRHLLDALGPEQVVQLGQISRAVIEAADGRSATTRLAAPPRYNTGAASTP